jgi:ATP-dependent DNA helicase RecG
MELVETSRIGIAPTLESEVEERKERWQDNCLEALAALANTRGGTLWIGVKDDGEPADPNGWADSRVKGKTEAILHKIVSKLGIHPTSITEEIWKGKPVLAISVKRAPSPVSLNGHYYRRVGNISLKVEGEALTRFLLEQTGSNWDSLPCLFSVDSLEEKAFADFKVLAKKRLPNLRISDDPATILNNLALQDREKRLLRAAVLLFGKNDEPQKLWPTAFVQIGQFRGDSSTILDERSITGNLFNQLDGVISELRRYLQVQYEMPNSSMNQVGAAILQREEIWEYPLIALREAIANALIHRDYTDTGRIMIRVYEDHVLITSPGTLPNGLTIDDILRNPHPSKLRNPLLASAFYFAGLIERWGSGTLRMASACLERGLPAPEFTQVGGELHVTFRKDRFSDARLKALGLSMRQITAVRFVQRKGSISNSEYQLEAKVAKRTATRDLHNLLEFGVFQQKGVTGKGTVYVLNTETGQWGQ